MNRWSAAAGRQPTSSRASAGWAHASKIIAPRDQAGDAERYRADAVAAPPHSYQDAGGGPRDGEDEANDVDRMWCRQMRESQSGADGGQGGDEQAVRGT